MIARRDAIRSPPAPPGGVVVALAGAGLGGIAIWELAAAERAPVDPRRSWPR
jgi:hypothetical protein